MSESKLELRPVLGDVETGQFGTAMQSPGVVLTALPEGHVLHLLADPAKKDIESDLKAAVAGLGSSLRKAAPGQWFAVGDNRLKPEEIRQLAASIAALAAVSDQSHGRVRIGAEGADVAFMLAKAIAADLDPSAFPTGSSATMISGHVTVHLTRLGSNSFELMSLRGFAPDLWDSLVHQSLEFGVECRKA